MKNLLTTILVLAGTTLVFAQETEALRRNKHLAGKTAPTHLKTGNLDTLSLPFVEEFSTSSPIQLT